MLKKTVGVKLDAHKKFFSKIGFNYLALGLIALISQIILINVTANANPTALNDVNLVYILSSLCNYILPFPIFYWLMKKLESHEIEKESVGVKKFLLYIAITMTLMWIGNIIGLTITFLLGGAMQSDIANPVHELIQNTHIWFNILIVSLAAPIFEELFFRKMLIDRSIKYGARISIILSALLFGLFHGNLNQFFYAFLMGGFFSYVYIKTGKVIYTIVLHAIVNLMGSVVSIMVVSSLTNLQTYFNPLDAFVLILYIIILFVFLLIGIYGLFQYKKAKFNGEKTEIALKNPLKTMILNYGMVLFIIFCVCEMAYQIIG